MLSYQFTQLCRVGHSVGELRLIFRPVPPRGQRPWWCKKFLVYVRRFDIIPQGEKVSRVRH